MRDPKKWDGILPAGFTPSALKEEIENTSSDIDTIAEIMVELGREGCDAYPHHWRFLAAQINLLTERLVEAVRRAG